MNTVQLNDEALDAINGGNLAKEIGGAVLEGVDTGAQLCSDTQIPIVAQVGGTITGAIKATKRIISWFKR